MCGNNNKTEIKTEKQLELWPEIEQLPLHFTVFVDNSLDECYNLMNDDVV